MKEQKRSFKILFFVLVSLIIVGCSVLGIGNVGKSTYSISGTVTGVGHAGLEGVTISLAGAGTASTTTDASGYFTFTNLVNGAYTITPGKEGFSFNPPSLDKVVSGANIAGVDFVAAAVSYIYVPGAKIYHGPLPSTTGRSAQLVVTGASPSGPLTMNSTITWTVTWIVTSVKVTYVDLYIPELDSYFEIDVTPGAAASGVVQFEMIQSDTPPADQVVPAAPAAPVAPATPATQAEPRCLCYYNGHQLRVCPCVWPRPPQYTTESLNASVVLVGGEGEVGVPVGGIGITWAGCGDGYCMDGEDSFTCPGDCPVVCGNLTCENGEDHSSCPGDCPSEMCGNAICESLENSSTCPADCKEELPGGVPADIPDISELPQGFPADIPNGTYIETCANQYGESYSTTYYNTNIVQFSQDLVSQMESMSPGVESACSGTGCTCDSNVTYTPWNGTYFTMTLTITVNCDGIVIATPITCTITAAE